MCRRDRTDTVGTELRDWGGDKSGKCFAIRKKLVDVTGIEPATPCLQSRCSPNGPSNFHSLLAERVFSHLLLAWVQVWVQLKKEKWLPISRKRHQIGQCVRPRSDIWQVFLFCGIVLSVSIRAD
jgi:hypothetical protein